MDPTGMSVCPGPRLPAYAYVHVMQYVPPTQNISLTVGPTHRCLVLPGAIQLVLPESSSWCCRGHPVGAATRGHPVDAATRGHPLGAARGPPVGATRGHPLGAARGPPVGAARGPPVLPPGALQLVLPGSSSW